MQAPVKDFYNLNVVPSNSAAVHIQQNTCSQRNTLWLLVTLEIKINEK